VDATLSDCRGNPAVSRAGDDTVLDDSGAKTENTLISSARMKTGNPDIVKAQLEATKSPTIQPASAPVSDAGAWRPSLLRDAG
jgi:hypothetical protein